MHHFKAAQITALTIALATCLMVPSTAQVHSADTTIDNTISLSELLRVIQFFNSGGYHCANPPESTEDGYAPSPNGTNCAPHASDYNPQDWTVSLSELLRLIQFFNSPGYHSDCASEDSFAPGPGAHEPCEVGPYTFDGPMPRNVLEAYLARSITMSDILLDWMDPYCSENLRMISHMGAKFLGRAVVVWGQESNFPGLAAGLASKTADVHAVDPEIIVQGGIFEFVSREVEDVAIPAWVFDAFELPPETRNFDYDAMTWSCGDPYLYEYPVDATVPDVARLETRLWIFYQAASYIDAGVEAIHMGQFEWMCECTDNLTEADALITRIRAHATQHARRHWILLDAHTHGLVRNGHLLLDFHSSPVRIKEGANPSEGFLEVGFQDAIYGDSRGGITPSGWACEHAPYLVEIDHGYAGDIPGVCDKPECVWGSDELSWFVYLTEAQRNAWLQYAWDWVRTNDPNGYLEMPGSRDHQGITPNASDWYFANTYNADTMPYGFNQEETIRTIWAADGQSQEE